MKQTVIRRCYALGVHAQAEAYDEVAYGDLRFDEVDWSDAIEHVRNRGDRTRRPADFDIEPEWATEALADPRRLV